MHQDAILSLAAAGRFDEAVAAAQALVAANPASAPSYGKLGSVLALAKRYEEAAKVLAVAIALDPGSAEALNNFGAVLRSVGKADEAQRYFERALDVSPGFHEALLNALGWYNRHARYAQAIARLHSAIDAGDHTPETYNELGLALIRTERPEAALEVLEKAVSLDPDFATAWANLANARMETGDLPGSNEAIREAIRIDPRRPEYYRFYTSTTRAAAPEYEEQLAALAHDGTLPPDQRTEAQFALGNIAAADTRWTAAFEHYVEGNRIRRAHLEYDEAAMLRQFDEIAAVFTKDVVARGGLGYHASQRPVFIFGMPRSGTTLVEQIVASHPDVYPAGELSLLDDIVTDVFATQGPITAEVANRYEAGIDRIAPSMSARVTDKMPLNFRYAGLIRMVFPHARMIHVKRDPIDTCWSCFSTNFVDGIAWTCDLGELGRFYRAYEHLMEHWRNALPPGSMLEVQYEDLVDDIDAHARRIIEYCGLYWDDRCLRFHETKRVVRTASATQVRRPLYRNSVGRSRAYGQALRPLADALGVSL